MDLDFELEDLDIEERNKWQRALLKLGQERYGDKHLDRYNLLDVAEEILDALNILQLFEDRINQEILDGNISEVNTEIIQSNYYKSIKQDLERLMALIVELDGVIPEELKTDDEGGIRDYLGDINNTEGGD